MPAKEAERKEERKEVCVGMGKWVGVVGGWMEQWWVGDGGHFYFSFFQLAKIVSVIADVLKQVPLMKA